jgi:hypothetical protein
MDGACSAGRITTAMSVLAWVVVNEPDEHEALLSGRALAKLVLEAGEKVNVNDAMRDR